MQAPLRLSLLFIFLTFCVASHADEHSAAVDKLFSRWNRRDSPGCALAVVKDGKIVYKKGYGMADLEQGVPIKPSTIFHIASTSKQFTAFSILLLEKEGKLSLDDEVRKYLPELHDFGKPITIRHLLHHTSGLRDQWSLLMMGGWRIDDVITEEDILSLVWRQRELNFEPNTAYAYCNTGYTLAAKIVERVSGKPLPQFAQDRIFGPLGMKRTHFHADYEEIVKDRAYSYNRSGESGYKNAILSYGNVGATSLFTTVEDLASWDENFYNPRVGHKTVLDRMQEVGKLADGKALDYALGLGLGEYRGLRVVEHGGGDAGYRCTLMRFPDQHFSVILLANLGDFDPDGLAHKVADIYLADKLKPTAASAGSSANASSTTAPKEISVDPALLDNYVGEYTLYPGMSVAITRDGDHLMTQATGQPKVPLFATSPTEFFVKVANARFTFTKLEQGKYSEMVVHVNGVDLPGKRFVRPSLTAQELADYVGDYHSAELGVLYTVFIKDGKLSIRYPRGVEPLQPRTADVFEAAFPIANVTFVRNAQKRVTGFVIDAGRVRNMRFTKVEIKPVE
jgi:CubicO group peptidase (beta-lactamase class C family)